jgi:hypothetical protein
MSSLQNLLLNLIRIFSKRTTCNTKIQLLIKCEGSHKTDIYYKSNKTYFKVYNLIKINFFYVPPSEVRE